MKIVAIHQPEHLPWLGFFDKMRKSDVFVLLDSTQFSKGDFQNRNKIKTKNRSAWMTVPVITKGRSKQQILETLICNERDWRRRCRTLIRDSYLNAPYFAEHWPFLEAIYARQWSKLVDLNMVIIEYLVEQLGINTRLIRASDLSVDQHGASNVLLAICQALEADVYLSGTCGRDYLDEALFQQHNIDVAYQSFQHPIYPQQWGDFLSHMSTIDLLMNCGNTSLERIAEKNLQVLVNS